MGNIGKGLVLLVTRSEDGTFAARVTGFVAIYSAVAIRDDSINEQLGKAMMLGPQKWQAISRLRRDTHERSASCWLHGPGFCFSFAA